MFIYHSPSFLTIFVKIQKQIIESIQQVAEDNKYDLVLSEGVLYASPKVDMTGLVIEYLTPA